MLSRTMRKTRASLAALTAPESASPALSAVLCQAPPQRHAAQRRASLRVRSSSRSGAVHAGARVHQEGAVTPLSVPATVTSDECVTP
jgi:hypothetical protein